MQTIAQEGKPGPSVDCHAPLGLLVGVGSMREQREMGISIFHRAVEWGHSSEAAEGSTQDWVRKACRQTLHPRWETVRVSFLLPGSSE